MIDLARLLSTYGPWRQGQGDHSTLAIAVEALLFPKTPAHGAQHGHPPSWFLKRAPVNQVLACTNRAHSAKCERSKSCFQSLAN